MIGYKMSLLRLRRNFVPLLQVSRRYVTASDSSEYVEKPQYPPILDISFDSRQYRKTIEWHDSIKSIKTVEEKIIEINMPKYYGWKCLMLQENSIPYNALPFVQHVTKTHFLEGNSLPEFYNEITDSSKAILQLIKDQIQEAILFELRGHRHRHEFQSGTLADTELDEVLGSAVVNHINRVLLNNLSMSQPHLFEAEIDLAPRHEAFWFAGGMNPPENRKKSLKGLSFKKDMADRSVDRAVQYIGSPILCLRSSLPLCEVIPSNTSTQFDVPTFKYDPRVLGYTHAYRHGTNIPGFWPGDKQEFGLLSYHPRSHIIARPASFGTDDNQEALHSQAILNSYGWLLAQANYQGFNTFNDISYPLTTQTVITNGHKYSFYVYQLNTTELHNNCIGNNKVNVCWGTKELELFEGIDESGKFINFNDDVLSNLIMFYLNKPVARQVNMKPYLDPEETYVANIKDDEKRIWLEKRYKHMISNRPRHRQDFEYEVYHWEKIYKIDNKTRSLEARRRPFELGTNPMNKRMDQHTPDYIPKVIRPGGPKSKDKWAKTFYPSTSPNKKLRYSKKQMSKVKH